MKKFFSAVFILCMTAILSAAYPLYFMSADQYQTVAGYRLHVVVDWSGVPFPPTDYTGARLMLSTYPMGNYPPYDAIAILETKLPERDPEFKLLGKMDTNVLWYGRLVFYAGDSEYAKTDEFTFVLEDPTLPSYSAILPWVAADAFDWNTSIVITNPTDSPTPVGFTMYSMTGNAIKTWNVEVAPHRTFAFYPSNDPDLYGYCGWMKIECKYKVAYEQMTIYFGTPSFAVSSSGLLQQE